MAPETQTPKPSQSVPPAAKGWLRGVGQIRPVEWIGDLDGYTAIIDQTLLPTQYEVLQCRNVETVHDAICRLAVRGAPAIGIAAAMGLVLGVRACNGDATALLKRVDEVRDYLAGSRPTAANLFWALDRMKRCAEQASRDNTPEDVKRILLTEANTIRDEDAAMCRAIGQAALPLIRPGAGVLTHCNAGALATAEYGTALAGIYAAHERGVALTVYVDETRPLLQGSRLTAWELVRAGIDATLICDNMAAQVMKEGKVDLVITGADRIAANGDTANKIGTYGLSVLAAAHGIPFYIAAPSTTFDLSIASGEEIPIEQRSADEIRRGFGRLTAPENIRCYCPAFDVTPAASIRAIITERGLIEPVVFERISAVLGRE